MSSSALDLQIERGKVFLVLVVRNNSVGGGDAVEKKTANGEVISKRIAHIAAITFGIYD